MRHRANLRKRKVLVLGKDTRAFLSVVRSLGRAGLEIHVGWCDPGSPAARSRYIRRIHEIPRPSLANLDWRHCLLQILERERFDLVIPCNDPSIIPLQLHKKAFLEFLDSIYLLDDTAFKIAFDKIESYELARSLGIPVPGRIRVTRLHDLSPGTVPFPLPVVVKPKASFTSDQLESKHHVRWARSYEALERDVRALLPSGDVSVEARFPGRGVGVETLAHQGEVLTAFQHLRLHEPPSGGGSSYRCSTDLHPELLHATKTFLKAIRYTGVAMVEFKVNEHTGQWAFIEINGRFWGSLPLALAAGADFPYFLYQMWVEGKRDFPQDFKKGISSRNIVNDLRWMRANWRADKNDPTLMTVPWRRVARELISLFTLRDHSDTLVRDDPGPGLLEIWQHARAVARSVERRIVSLFLSRVTVRERQATQLRSALREAKRVLFVCKGNICRSPFAHRLAETLFPQDLAVASAGYYQQSGRRCPAEAIQIAAEMGIDLRSHRSEVLSAKMLQEADVVLIFDSDNYLELRGRYTWVMPKVHLVGVLADRRTTTIRDPYGGTHADFLAAYAAIHESLTAVAKTVLAVTPHPRHIEGR